jgi:sterol desaturase/sphingolipid hydroxylase (fatty acid hydroxylase superfamily)
MAHFNHGNIRLPGSLDRALRWLVVTPDMHRVHHSIEPKEFNRNFGFNLSCWDRIFGSYVEDSEAGQEGMTIGQSAHLDAQSRGLAFMLLLPFKPTK